MPPRFAYWTIIIDDAPTAFRARDRAELLGVLRQLANRNPNAVMKWFAHGKLWDSPEQERAAAREAARGARAEREARGPDWRPGGKHEDPRARFDKRNQKRRREHDQRSGEGVRAAGERQADRGREKEPRGPMQGRPPRKAHPERREARPIGRDRKPWERSQGRPDRAGAHRSNHPGSRLPRGAARSRPTPSERPAESEPPAPPEPPSPEHPPNPEREPSPERPPEETIKILPEPPERAKGRKRG